MRVLGITIYPVKSTGGLTLQRAEVQRWGLCGDRRWAVVDSSGAKVTARTHPGLLRVSATPVAGGGIAVHAAGMGAPLAIAAPSDSGDPMPVAFSQLDHAVSAGAAGDAWFSELLGEPVRLVWLDDPERRAVAARHGGRPGEVVSLADAAPLLMTTQASLHQLDRWVAEEARARGERAPDPLVMARFRPNLVVDGEAPFAEDDYAEVRVGELRFRVASGCDRCVMTTVDPVTLRRGKEPIRTLARRRSGDGKVWFGVRLVPVEPGTIQVGDAVTALSAE
ncbi:MAG: MOSC domain-containing protein [Micromonosporaceae bacterium]